MAKAINAYEESLRIRTVESYPIDYAMTQNNLGTAYCTLSEVRDKEKNLAKAINAYGESLKIYTVESYPLIHEIVKSNLDIAKNRTHSDHL